MKTVVPRSLALVVFPLVLACSQSGNSQEFSYDFTRIAQSNSSEVELGFPVINNSGQIAYYEETPRKVQVFRVDGRRRTSIWKRSGPVLMGSLAIGDRGDVAFPVSFRTGKEVILRGRGGGVTTIADTALGVFDSFTFAVSVNRDGTVAFGPDLESGDEGIFLGKNRRTSPLYLDSNSPLADNPKPSINNQGWVGFTAFTDTEQGVFVWNGERFITIADTTSPLIFQVFSDTALNEQGDVAFTATVDDPADPTQPGPLTLFTGREGSLRKIADTSEAFLSFEGNPSINDQGEVLFVAELPSGGEALNHGLYLASGEQLRRVIGTGDALDGSRVLTLHLADDRTLNNAGQLVFGAQLEDGRFAIYRATPNQ